MARLIIMALLLLIYAVNDAQTRWHINLTPGLSYVPPVPLSIKQENQETINLWAKYESAPLKLPPYYSVRLGFSKEGKGWEVEMNHLKVYLKNKPNEIGRFSISHGYNQILINRIFKTDRLNSKAGLGIVAAHPENSVRGHTLND